MQGKTHSFAITIDIGGTFTDVVLSDLNDGEYHLLGLPRQSKRIAGKQRGSGGTGGIAEEAATLGGRILVLQP